MLRIFLETTEKMSTFKNRCTDVGLFIKPTSKSSLFTEAHLSNQFLEAPPQQIGPQPVSIVTIHKDIILTVTKFAKKKQ